MWYVPGMNKLLKALRAADVNDMDDLTLHELQSAIRQLSRDIEAVLDERGTGWIG